MIVVGIGPVSWVAAQILPQYLDQEATPTVELNMFEDAVNRVSPYTKLMSAACDADFQQILNDVRSEWRWGVGIVRPQLRKYIPQER